jgi:hypothetical protein
MPTIGDLRWIYSMFKYRYKPIRYFFYYPFFLGLIFLTCNSFSALIFYFWSSLFSIAVIGYFACLYADINNDKLIIIEEQIFKHETLKEIDIMRDHFDNTYGHIAKDKREQTYNSKILPVCLKLRSNGPITTEDSGKFLAAIEHPMFRDLIDQGDTDKYSRAAKVLIDIPHKDLFINNKIYEYGIGLKGEEHEKFLIEKKAFESKIRNL